MQKINAFQITGMTLSGFKAYAQATELTLGSLTTVTGGNGAGKSSIADAIAFVITGLPFFGERGIDRLHSEDNPALFVALRFTDETGIVHELTRTRQKSRTGITYDGYEIRQLDLTELFGEKDVFLSIFNPLYFIEELGDDGKNLLERCLPAISHEDVLALLSDETRLSLESESILSPDAYLKKRREEIRELEERGIYLGAQKDLILTQQENQEQTASEISEKLAALNEEIGSLEALRFENLDRAAYEEQLIACSARYEEMARDAASGTDGAQTDERVSNLIVKLEMRRAEPYCAKYVQPIADANARLGELGEQYRRDAGLRKAFTVGTTCPTCRRAVTEASLPEVLSALDRSLADTLEGGKQQQSQLAEMSALEQNSKEIFLQFQTDDVQKLEAELAELTAQRPGASEDHEIAEARRNAELDAIKQEIRAMTTALEYGNLTQEEYDRLQTGISERAKLDADLSALQRVADLSAADYDAQIEAVKTQITAKKKLLGDAALYISKRAEMTFSKLRLNRVAISLYDVVKTTGEVKDAFRFTYNGRPYNRLSLSEKIRAGLEVSELLKRLTGRNYPIFVDNMESVDDLANVHPTGQVIMAKCVHGAALSVTPMGGVSTQPKAA